LLQIQKSFVSYEKAPGAVRPGASISAGEKLLPRILQTGLAVPVIASFGAGEANTIMGKRMLPVGLAQGNRTIY